MRETPLAVRPQPRPRLVVDPIAHPAQAWRGRWNARQGRFQQLADLVAGLAIATAVAIGLLAAGLVIIALILKASGQ